LSHFFTTISPSHTFIITITINDDVLISVSSSKNKIERIEFREVYEIGNRKEGRCFCENGTAMFWSTSLLNITLLVVYYFIYFFITTTSLIYLFIYLFGFK
jgi:hypothetical protein